MYSVTKTAVQALVRVLAEKMVPTRVLGLHRGLSESTFRSHYDNYRMRKQVPHGKLDTPDDIGDVIAFLCSCSAIPVAIGFRSKL